MTPVMEETDALFKKQTCQFLRICLNYLIALWKHQSINNLFADQF